MERLEHGELLRHDERRVVGQHHAARSDLDAFGRRREVGDEDRGSGAGHARHVVVLRHPEAAIAQRFGGARQPGRVGQGVGARLPRAHDREVEHGQRDGRWCRGAHPPCNVVAARSLPAANVARASGAGVASHRARRGVGRVTTSPDDTVLRRLQEERARATERIAALTREFDAIVEASQLVSADDEHDPDGATVAFERAQVAGLLRAARDDLAEADLAVAGYRAGSYGCCEGCGRPIGAERLDAVPTTRTCVACAR